MLDRTTGDIGHTLAVLHRRKGLIVAVVVAAVLAATIYNYTTRPVYSTRAVLLVTPPPADRIGGRAVAGVNPQQFGQKLQEQVGILTSHRLASLVVEQLQLNKHPDLRAGPVLTPWERLRRLVGSFVPQTPGVDLPVSPAVGVFRSRLTVEAQEASNTIELRFASYDPDVGPGALNLLMELYRSSASEFVSEAGTEAESWLDDRLAEQRLRIERAKKALLEYEEREGLAGLAERIHEAEQRIAEAERTLSETQAERLARSADLEKARGLSLDEAAVLPSIRSRPAIQKHKDRLIELERERARLAETLGDRHPDMVRINQETRITRDLVTAETRRAVEELEVGIREAAEKEKTLRASVEPLRQDLAELRRRTGEQSLLQQEVAANEQMYNRLIGRSTEASVASATKLDNIQILEAPERPTSPASPQRMRNLRYALLGGLIVGIFLALLVEQLDGSVKTPEDIKAHFDVPFLGIVPEVTVPRGASGSPSVLITKNPRSTLAESYRVIRTNLLFSAPPQASGRVVLVTSVSPADGKSTTSVNVAASLALNGHRVVLIDADLRRPVLHRLVGVASAPGLTDLIVGKASTAEAVRPSGIDKLDLVPCGYVPPNPAELLGSSRMREFLNELRASHEWVIVDAPPFLAMADAAVLSPSVDGVLIVVASERTPQSGLARVLDQLASVGGRVVGAVLNRVDLERNSYYFGRYYGEYYRSYYSEGSPRPDGGEAKRPRGRSS